MDVGYQWRLLSQLARVFVHVVLSDWTNADVGTRHQNARGQRSQVSYAPLPEKRFYASCGKQEQDSIISSVER